MSQVTKLNIPDDAKDTVVFMHGFGVRWDSRGMFTDIQKSLPEGWGSVLFDFYDIQDNDVYITSINDQLTRLQDILRTVATTAPKVKIHIVAHSKGCIITALAKPKVSGRVIMLAPPENFGTKIEAYFRRYPNTTEAETELIIPRRDGTITHIPKDYFTESSTLKAQDLILEYSKHQHIEILQTTQDEVLGTTSYDKLKSVKDITITQIASDHNFTNTNRQLLIQYLLDTLTAS